MLNNGAMITKGSITAVVDGTQYVITSDNTNFNRAYEAARTEQWDELANLCSPAKLLIDFGNGRVSISEGNVVFDGEVVHNVITDRMLEMAQEGFNVEPIANFMVNLNNNPSRQAVQELYLFLEANNLAITPDGHFLAYKKVRENYRDVHSNTFDNSIGSVCEMPRNQVNDRRDETCSSGLHFCSLDYLAHFSGEHTMILKINPADVVSIPSDYNNAKGRTCRYEVVAEHDRGDTTSAFDEPVVDFGGDLDDDKFLGLDASDCEKNNSRYEAGTPDWAIEQAHVMAHDEDYRNWETDNEGWTYENAYGYIKSFCNLTGSATEFRTNKDALEEFYDLHNMYMKHVVHPRNSGNSKENLAKRANAQHRDSNGRFC